MIQQSKKNIVIAGAGIAGLACGQKLIEAGYAVTILEASKVYGGRIRPLRGFLKTPLEAGGQEIHHRNTPYLEMAKSTGAKITDDHNLDDLVWDPHQKQMIKLETFEERYPKEGLVFDHLEENFDDWDKDCSIMEQLERDGFDTSFNHFFEAVFGAEYGVTATKISARGVGLCESTFPSFEENFCFNNIYHIQILEKYFDKAIENVKLQCAVEEVEYSNGVTIRYRGPQQNQEEITSDIFVSAVPITQVKKIKWSPPFDQRRQSQLDLVDMDQGGKLFIKLDKVFKPGHWNSLIIKSKKNILLWNNSSKEEGCVIALVAEDGAKEIEAHGLNQYAQGIIADLNTQINSDYVITDVHFQNWGKEPFIEGLYSYPKPGIDGEYRQIIGEPIKDQVFFCGEAYHNTFWATITGALETGYNVAEQIKKL